jgi:hypothetical protein
LERELNLLKKEIWKQLLKVNLTTIVEVDQWNRYKRCRFLTIILSFNTDQLQYAPCFLLNIQGHYQERILKALLVYKIKNSLACDRSQVQWWTFKIAADNLRTFPIRTRNKSQNQKVRINKWKIERWVDHGLIPVVTNNYKPWVNSK